jgi:gliding motility-associated-like protein
MKKVYVILSLLTTLLLYTQRISAQTTNFQNTVTKCYTGPTQDFGNTIGTAVGNVNFISGVDIPPGHRIIDVVVEVVWSKTDDGSCTPTTGAPVDLSHVGFTLKNPTSSTRIIAASATTGPFATTSTTSSFIGATNIVEDTIVFKHNAPSLLPAGLPTAGRDTVSPNGSSLDFYFNQSPYGTWTVGAIDDAPAAGPRLCIHSYCITLVTCDFNSLEALCSATPTVALDGLGVHNFQFIDLDSASDVSCNTTNISFAPNTVSCADIGTPVAVTMILEDQLGNVDSCSSMVNVVDTTAPTFSNCFPSIWGNRYLGVDGRDTFWASLVDATDNCGSVIKEVRPLFSTVWTDKLTFNCTSNFQQFWARATDASGNMDSCRLIVRYIDTIPPTAICGQDTVFLSSVAGGFASIPAINLDGGSFDVCPPVVGRWIGSQFAPPPTYSCADLGTDTVRLIVADVSGNLDTCDNAVIVIMDTIPPVPSCWNDTVYLQSNGIGSISATEINNLSSDICGVDSINLNGSSAVSFNCSHLNSPQTVTLNVFDASGNVDSCWSMIQVLDTFPPIANCRNQTVYLDANGVTSISADSFNNNSLDFCTGTNLTFAINGSPSISFDCSQTATNPNSITLTVIDSFGNSSTCNAMVTVLDTIAPVAICASPNIYLSNTGVAFVSPAELSLGGTDNCGIVDSFVNTIGAISANFDCTAIFAPQPITLIVQDASGNIDSCTTVVNVLDTISPAAQCRNNIIVQLDPNGLGTATPNMLDSNSNDNCSIVRYLINNLDTAHYSCADLGTQSAILTVIDSSANSSTCTTLVTVQDNIAPAISCQSLTGYLNSSGVLSVNPNQFIDTVTTFDNCSNTTVLFADGSNSINYTCDSLGTRSVGIMITDNFGNTAQCVTNIMVLDSIAPIAICRSVPYTVQLDSNSQAVVVPSNIDNGSFDICQLDTLLINGLDSLFFDCTNLGSNSVSLLVQDQSGNAASCATTVIVEDIFAPTAICRDTLLYLNNSGVTQLSVQQIDGGSFDNCSAVNLSINGAASVNYDCSQVGSNSVQLTVIDAFGNTSQCLSTVQILDTIDPIANCINPGVIDVYLDSNCFAIVPAIAFNNNSNDNCSNSINYSINGLPNAIFNAGNIGNNPNTVTLTVSDPSGNQTTCNTTVNVFDTILPNIICRPDTLLLTGSSVTLTPNRINNNSFDNCSSPSLTINGQSSLSFDCTQLGTNPVTLIGTDIDGNVDSCSTTVTILDVAPPLASCQFTTTLALDSSTNQAILDPLQVNSNSTDNCSIASYRVSQDTFDCSYIGQSTTIQLIVTDQSGNSDTCNSQIIVEDTINPIAQCVGADTLYYTGVVLNITPNDIDAGSFDNCGLLSIHLSQDTFDCPDIGRNTITLFATDSSGNIGTCITDVYVIDSTVVAEAGNDQLLCSSDSTTLNAMTPNTGLSGQWTTNNPNIVIINDTLATTTITNIPDGVHTLYWTLSSNSCSNISTDSISIEVISPILDTAFAGFDQSLCEANTITLAGNQPSLGTAQWIQTATQASTGSTITNPIDSSTSVTGLSNGSYTYVWEFINGNCGVYDRDTVVINIDVSPNINAIAGTDFICSPDTIALNAVPPSNGDNGLWSTSDSTVTIFNPSNPFSLANNFTSDTTLLIWSLSRGTCLNYSSDTLLVILGDEQPIALPDTFIFSTDGMIKNLNVTSNDLLPSVWNIIVVDDVDNGNLTNISNGNFSLDIDQVRVTQYFTYEITNTSCPDIRDSAEVVIYIEETENCYVPNTFTPNGDGSNDRFIVPCLDNLSEKAALSVFNRWGNLVYQTDNYLSDWEGTHNDRPLPNGTYFYILKITNKAPQKGSVEIRR